MAHNVLITPASGKIEWADHSTGSTHVGTPDFTLQNCDDSLQLTNSSWTMHPQNLAHANIPTGTSTGSLYPRTDDDGHLHWMTNDASAGAAGGAINQNISCRDCLHGHGEEIVLVDDYLRYFYGCCNADFCLDFGGTLEWCHIAELKIYIHHAGKQWVGWGGQNTMTHYMYGRRDGHPTHLCSCLPLICINAGCYPTYDQKHLRGDEYSLQFYSSDTSSSRNISGGSGDTAVCCSHDFCHTRYNWPNLCDSVYYDALPADASTILSSAATIRLNQPSSTIVNGYAQSCTASTFNVTCYSPSTHNNWHCHHDTGSGGQVYITAGSRYHHCVTDVTQFAYPSFTGNTLCWYMGQPLNCISRFKIYTGSFGTYNSSMGDGAGTTILCVRYNCCHYFCGINRSTTPYVNSTAICFNGFLTIHSTYYGSWVTASSASFSGGYPAPLIYAAGAAPSKKDAFTTLWTHANAICGMRFQLAKGSNGCKLSALNGWTRVTVTYLPAIGPSSSLGLGKNEVFV